MNLPPPPVNQGTGTVDVALLPGTGLPVSIYAANRSAGQAVPAGTNPTTGEPNPTVEELYDAASFGALGLAGGVVNAFRTSAGSTNSFPRTAYLNYNLDPGSDAGLLTLQGLQYKLRVIFPVPWRGSNSVHLAWRVKTTNYTGSQTTPFGGAAETPVETGAQTYVAKSETFTPLPGDTYAETTVYTIDATDLTLGDTVSIVGSASTAPLAPGFAIALRTANGAKRGFLAYIFPQSAPGEPVTPNPIYTNEAASTAESGAPAGALYTGSQDVSVAGFTTNTFSANVSGNYQSATSNNYPSDLGYDAQSNIRKAGSVTPAVAVWPGGLVMTLSNPQDTSTITAPADVALAAINFATLFPDGVATGGGPGLVVALRDLPAHEQSYGAAKSVYSITLGLDIDTGLPSQFLGGTAPLVNTGSLAFSWTRETIDLDTGMRSSSTLNTSVDFTGVPGLNLIAFSGMPADLTPTGAFLSLYYTEDVPATNQRVEVSGLTVTTATLDCLGSGPQAVVVATA
jgi:hypothetical protein